MTLAVPSPPRFHAVYSNVGGVRPAGQYGTIVTPGNNTYGSYVSVLSALATEAYGLKVVITGNFVSAAARDTILTIGIDPAGGTTFTDRILHLLCSSAGDWSAGAQYSFPHFHIPSGASVGAKASVNNATVGTLGVALYAYAKPDRPEMHRVGHFVETIGAVTASSRGTTVTSGTTAEGSWTSLGTLANDAWWWQAGMGINDAAMTGGSYSLDLAFGATTKTIIFEDLGIDTDSAPEQISFQNDMMGRVCEVAAGEEIFARLQCSAGVDSGLSVAAYALR